MVSSEHVDLAPPEAAPRKVTIQADPQNITLDLARTAIIVVDMQIDFCAPGGWVDNLGADLTPERAPIRPLQALIPALREARAHRFLASDRRSRRTCRPG